MTNEQTHDLTDAAPTLEPKTRKKVTVGLGIALGVAATVLIIDDQLKKLKRNKRVTLTVADQPDES